MNDKIYTVRQIITVIIFIIVLSTMGMITQRPIMMLAYGLFFVLVSLGIFFSMKNRQRHYEVSKTSNVLIRKILGAAMMLLALFLPMIIALRSSMLSLPEEMSAAAVAGATFGLSLFFIACVLITLYLINDKGFSLANRVIGYIVFIIAAAVPGLLMSRVDSTTMGIGSVYYVAVAVLILAYNAKNLFCVQD